MKKTTLLTACLSLLSLNEVWSQNVNVLPLNGNGQNPNAYCGIGIKPDLDLPVQNLQIYGRYNYTRQGGPGRVLVGVEGQTPGSPVVMDYGVTSAISLGNTVTGNTVNDGAIIRMSQQHFTIDNLEPDGNITLAANGANMTFVGLTKKIYAGGTFFNINNQAATFNVFGNNSSGINIRANGAGNSGLTVQMTNDSEIALGVFGSTVLPGNSTSRSFAVRGNGEVFARKYTTTLNNIPDYVFDLDYKLLTFEELRAYIHTNKHLVNVPSAQEFAANGVDLGEMNRLLLEKVEELTLYILQLEERMKLVEENQK